MWAILTVPGLEGNKWDPEAFYKTGRDDINLLFEQLDAAGLKPASGRALDFGCGMGRLSFALADRFAAVDGVDVAPSMIERARQQDRGNQRCTFHLNSNPDLSLFPNDSFDFILTLITLQHMEPQYSHSYIAEFVRVLKPGGILVFQLPCKLKHVPTPPKAVGTPAEPPPENLYKAIRRKFRWLRRLLNPPKQVHQTAPSGPEGPVMEMYGTPVQVAKDVVQAAGGRVLKTLDDPSAGVHWENYRYFVTK